MSILLDDYIFEQIDSRIVSSPTIPDDLEIFSEYDLPTGPFVYNSECWASDLDFTGIGWTNQGSGEDRVGIQGTLISPRHILTSEHITCEVGGNFYFIKSDGSLIIREVTGVQDIPASDMKIAYLESDVPAGITFYSVLPGDYLDYMEWRVDDLPCIQDEIDENHIRVYSILGKPILFLRYSRRAYIGQVNVMMPYIDIPTTLGHCPGVGDRTAYWGQVAGGDSGWAGFFILEEKLVLLKYHMYPCADSPCGLYSLGPFCSVKTEEINQAMEDLDTGETGYQLTIFDLAGIQTQFTAGLDIRGLSEGLYSIVTQQKDFSIKARQTYQDGLVKGEVYQDGIVEKETYQNGVVKGETYQDGQVEGEIYQDGAVEAETVQ